MKGSLDVSFKLNVDPKKGGHAVRGTCILPAGTGKDIRVCVFAPDDMVPEVKEAGADVIGTDSMLKEAVEKGVYEFDKIIATPETVKLIKPYARILGPLGFMPSSKGGNLVKADKVLESLKLMK